VEEFGMHLNEDGSLIYAMRVDAIQDRKADDISLDMLSRLVVDVMQDSSQIADSLLSFYQKSLLTMVFLGDELMRDKFAIFIADGIKPKLEASRYMDREDNENELKQILGDTDAAYNLSPDDVLIVGRNGVLIAGPGSRKHEDILLTYLSLLSRDMFLRVFFTRVFVLQNELNKIRAMLG
jgi:WD repeat-containing protein 35